MRIGMIVAIAALVVHGSRLCRIWGARLSTNVIFRTRMIFLIFLNHYIIIYTLKRILLFAYGIFFFSASPVFKTCVLATDLRSYIHFKILLNMFNWLALSTTILYTRYSPSSSYLSIFIYLPTFTYIYLLWLLYIRRIHCVLDFKRSTLEWVSKSSYNINCLGWRKILQFYIHIFFLLLLLFFKLVTIVKRRLLILRDDFVIILLFIIMRAYRPVDFFGFTPI